MNGLIDFINNQPYVLALIYLGVEFSKALLPFVQAKAKAHADKNKSVTDAVFDLYGLAREDLEIEKKEIRELTRLLKKANLEISIMERKIAALMLVIDKCMEDSSSARKFFQETMGNYRKEVESLKKERGLYDDDFI